MRARLLPTRRTAAIGGSSRRPAGATTLPKLAAVLLAALTAVAGLPIAGSAAAAGIASTGGQTESSSAAPEGTTTASPSGLTPDAARTFNAHDDTDGAFAAAAAQTPDDSTAQTTDSTAQTTDGASAETDADDGAQAQNTVTLAASSITRTGATLTITNHTAAWYWQRHSVAPGPCNAMAANTATATLTGLTAATAYTYKAYSDSSCSTELTTDATDAEFTTPGIVLSAFHTVVTEGSSATYTVKLATAPTSDVTVTVSRATDRYPGVTVDTDSNTTGDQSTLTFTSQDWGTAQTVTVQVAADSDDWDGWEDGVSLLHEAAGTDAKYSGASAANAVTVIDSTAPVLSAASVTATGATLSITNRTRAWYYRGLAYPGTWGACTSVAANTASVTLSGLAAGTDYTYHAYSDSACTSEITEAVTRTRFTTPGVKLSTLKLIAPEGSTATYTARLATKPAGSVAVTITKDSGGDTDLTVDTDPNRGGNQNTLTFTAANWDVPQTITVAAAEETDSTDKLYGTATFSHAATSGYTTTAASTLTVTEGDNDVCPGTTAVGGSGVTTGGLVDDCNTLLAAKTMLAGTSTAIDNWATTLAIASWTGITTANSRVSRLNALRNSLDGSIPNTLGNLTNLESITLSDNNLSGAIPAELGNLTNLESITLSDNNLSGAIPAELGNLTNLTNLWLGGNALSGQIPAQLGNLTNLTHLSLGSNVLSGQIPTQLGNLTNLTSLGLSSNVLSGQIPTQLGNLTNLTRLDLDYNVLSGQIPTQLGNLTNLRRLDLARNVLSGQIPTQLGNLTNLEWMILSNNNLSGAIPAELGNLTNLRWLYLPRNVLSGQIPTQLGNLTNLTNLWLGGNALSGQIPTQLGNLTNLTHLSLGSNVLSGQIPTQLGNLTNLFHLNLGSNELSGPIPAELGNLTNLTWLWLDDNALSGQIPTQLGNLTNLTNLWLHGNVLSGCLPSNWHRYASSTSRSYALNPQQAGRTLAVCDGIVLSDARPSVGEGSTADYTVRLSTAPSSTVTVTVSATGDSDITVDTNTTTGGNQDTLTFTTQNWATAQAVRLSAAQDTDAVHGTATLTHTAASSDSTYSGTMATAVATEADDETGLNAVSVSATGATLETSNLSGAWYHRQSSPTQGTCAPGTVSEYDPGTADLTGLSPNTAYTFKAYSDSTCSTEITAAATDAEFTTASGVLLSRTHLDAAEGSTATYTVELATAPTHSVTVALTKATGGDGDLTFNPSSLTFSTTDWDTAQTVTVTAAADSDTDDGSAMLVHTPSSTDAKYNSSPASIKVTERDNDAVLSAYTVSAHNATLLLENVTGIWHFKQTSPTVGACLGPLNASDGVVTASLHNLSPDTSYTFKAYKAPNRNEACNSNREITTDATDADFTTPAGGIVLSAHSLTVAEGSTATYTVKLSKRPTADVTVNITPTVTSDTDLTANPTSLTFTAGNWNIAQTVTVTAGTDNDTDDGTATLVHAATSSDDSYNNLSVTVTATENDSNGVSLAASSVSTTGATLTISNHTAAWYWQRHSVAPGPCSSAVAANTATATLTGLTPATAYTFKAYSDSTCATELTNDTRDADFTTPGLVFSVSRVNVAEGSTAAYAVKLATAPTSDVTVTVSPARSAHRVTADTDTVTSGEQSALTFTSQNWDIAQTVTVKAATNPYFQGSETTGFEHTATSSDSSYSGAVASVGVWMVDQEAARLTVSSVTATGAMLTVRHNFSTVSEPWYYEAIATPGSRRACTSVAAGTSTVALTGLTPGTEYLYRTYLDPDCSDGDTTSSWDTEATFTTPGVRLSTLNLIAPEGATAAYTARLATKPAGNVTVTVTKGAGGDSDLTVDTDSAQSGNQSTLTFTAANWDVPQTVTVAAADESDSTDKAYGTATFSHAATSGYTTTAASTLTVTEGDNDVCPGTTAVGGATVTTGGLVDDCNTLLAAKTMLAGTSTAIDNWATTLAIASWTGIGLADSRVIALDIADYSLNGTMPNTLGNLTELRDLGFVGSLSGQLPSSLGSLSELTNLLVWGHLSGPVPAELGNLAKLTTLDLRGSQLAGSIPAELGNLAKLTTLDLGYNRLSGSIPLEIGSLTELQLLNFASVSAEAGEPQLAGPIPAELGYLTKLTNLYLGGQRLSGPIPATLRRLTKLQNLSLEGNLLSGPIPAGLGEFTSLVELGLAANLLSGSIPTEIGGLAGLERMRLFNNALTGQIPTGLGNLTKLTNLDLGGNELSGSIPAELGNLTSLHYLELESNELSGPIPAELGNLTKLTRLNMTSNALSGSIPAELGNLTSLTELHLAYNRLSGQIPAELGNLTSLYHLGLGSNELSGSIPAELGNLATSGGALLNRNLLSGCIPANWHRYHWLDWYLNPQQFGKKLALCDGIALSATRLSVSEGSTADYTVRLSSAPTSTVTVTVTVSATGDSDITVDTNTTTGGNQDTLTFTTQNWDTAQTVRLTAAQDTDAVDGTATLTHTAASSDSTYSGTVVHRRRHRNRRRDGPQRCVDDRDRGLAGDVQPVRLVVLPAVIALTGHLRHRIHVEQGHRRRHRPDAEHGVHVQGLLGLDVAPPSSPPPRPTQNSRPRRECCCRQGNWRRLRTRQPLTRSGWPRRPPTA